MGCLHLKGRKQKGVQERSRSGLKILEEEGMTVSQKPRKSRIAHMPVTEREQCNSEKLSAWGGVLRTFFIGW